MRQARAEHSQPVQERGAQAVAPRHWVAWRQYLQPVWARVGHWPRVQAMRGAAPQGLRAPPSRSAQAWVRAQHESPEQARELVRVQGWALAPVLEPARGVEQEPEPVRGAEREQVSE